MAEATHTYEEGTCPNRRCKRKLYIAPSVRVAQCPGCGEGFMVKRINPTVPKNNRPVPSPEVQARMMEPGWMRAKAAK